jgi:hypothetical protein
MIIIDCYTRIIFLSTSIFKQQDQALVQQYIQTIKHRNLVIDLGNGVKTNAQLTYPAIGKGPFPGVLLIQGFGTIEQINIYQKEALECFNMIKEILVQIILF